MKNDSKAPLPLKQQIRHLQAKIDELETELARSRAVAHADATHQWFSTFMDNSPVAAWIKDEQGRYVYVNEPHNRFFPFESGSPIGQSDEQLHAGKVARQLRKNDQKVLACNEPIQTVEEVPLPDGRAPHWLVCKFPLEDAEGNRFVGGVALDVTEQRTAEAEVRHASRLQQLLLRELDHRVRNNLLSLHALIELTRESAKNIDDFADSISSRVNAMSVVHGLLTSDRWASLQLEHLIRSLIPPDLTKRAHCSGPTVWIVAQQGTAIGMILQELISNSVKYGAFSTSSGHVDIAWIERERDDQCMTLELHWRENGGPSVSQPRRGGVGTRLIEGLTAELSGNARFSFPVTGADHQFDFRLQQIRMPSATDHEHPGN